MATLSQLPMYNLGLTLTMLVMTRNSSGRGSMKLTMESMTCLWTLEKKSGNDYCSSMVSFYGYYSWRLFINVFSAPINGRSQCYASLQCFYFNVKTINKSCKIMWRHKHINLLYIGSLCNIALSMARFTCIVTS